MGLSTRIREAEKLTVRVKKNRWRMAAICFQLGAACSKPKLTGLTGLLHQKKEHEDATDAIRPTPGKEDDISKRQNLAYSGPMYSK